MNCDHGASSDLPVLPAPDQADQAAGRGELRTGTIRDPASAGKPIRILNDMDEVLADFRGGMVDFLGLPKEAVAREWAGWIPSASLFQQATKIQVTDGRDAMRAVDSHSGPKFWADLPQKPWTKQLWEEEQKLGAQIGILSAPSQYPSSEVGKAMWLKQNLDPAPVEVILDKEKHLYADPRTILVDDSQRNVEAFRKAGGHAVLVPSLGNDRREEYAQYSQAGMAELLLKEIRMEMAAIRNPPRNADAAASEDSRSEAQPRA